MPTAQIKVTFAAVARETMTNRMISKILLESREIPPEYPRNRLKETVGIISGFLRLACRIDRSAKPDGGIGIMRCSDRIIKMMLAGTLLSAVWGNPATAQSLEEALARAYVSNPTIESQRAQLRATDELVPQALSGYRPTVEAGADATNSIEKSRLNETSAERRRTGQSRQRTSLQSRTVDLNVVQPLYSGGRTQAATKQAEALVQSGRADLLSVEQTVLLDGATAYLDVVRDQAVLDLNKNNEQVLRRQLQASRDRFNVGEITRTDVSQAESRVARAVSDRIESEGLLSSSRAVFARVIGTPPGRLTAPRLVFDLPASRVETVSVA
jgi:outer membrane protein TolC